MSEKVKMTMAQKHFVSMVYDYGARKENCLAFDNIHIMEGHKNAIISAWHDAEKAISNGASDDDIDTVILEHWRDFIR